MENNYEDEMSIKELIKNLIQERKIIMFTTIAVTIMAVIVSFFIIKPLYETSTIFVMDIPSSIQTKIGVYNYITTDHSDYLDLMEDPRVLGKTIDDLSLKMSISDLGNIIDLVIDDKNKEKKTLAISIKGSDPELITKIVNVHIDNYISFLNNEFKYKAINNFLKNYEVSLNLIERNMNITNKKLDESRIFLSELSPVTTLQIAISSNPEVAAKYAEDRGINVKDLTNDMLYSEIQNPSYVAMETQILDYRKNLSNSKISLEDLKSKITELTSEKKALDLYNETGDESKLRSNYLDIFKNKIQVISPAFIPENAIGPKKTQNIIIGFALGLMLGIFVALVKTYWEKN